MCTKYNQKIKKSREEFVGLYLDDTTYLTEGQKEDRKLKLVASLQTVKGLLKTYKKYNEELTTICDNGDGEGYISRLETVLQDRNYLGPILQKGEEKIKKKLNCKGLLNSITEMNKLIGSGDNRYLIYFIFYSEFKN